MTERPILFSAPMVRAILAGTKTQTRRVVKLGDRLCRFDADGYSAVTDDTIIKVSWDSHSIAKLIPCPYGQPGDMLWVRETSRAHELTDKEAEADTFGVIERLGLEVPPCGLDGVVYAADNAFREIENSREASERWMKMSAYRGMQGATVPAIHMPRWASRITLEVTGVRVERLQDISEADALAEGISRLAPPAPPHEWSGLNRFTLNGMGSGFCAGSVSWNSPTAEALYLRLWEDIHGPGSWEANPWVWVVEFKVVAQ